MKRRHPTLIVKIVFGITLMSACSGQLWEHSKSQVKEPPIPVIIGKGQTQTSTSDGQSIVMTVADFNYLMAREDSLRHAITRQNQIIKQESRSRSFLVFALVLGLVLSNIASIRIVSKRSERRKRLL